MSWLDSLVNEHKDFEPPLNFWRWAGLATISAVLKDNVWMDRYIYKLYPNVYVMLHADSGLKKGPPINLSKKLVTKAIGPSKIITGRSSIQAILKKMGTSTTAPGKPLDMKSVAYICSSELTSSIVDDPIATTILTDLYDRNYNEGDWESLLKMENFKLRDPIISMLTATNESMSDDFFKKSAISGGYFARTFIIHETKRNKKNSLAFPPEHLFDVDTYVGYLKDLAALKGQFEPFSTITEDAKFKHLKKKDGRNIYFSDAGLIYDNWYDDFTDLIDSQEAKDETGTLNRFGDSVIKVAMLLSLSRMPILAIGEDSMTEAIEICEKLLGNVRKTTAGKLSTNTTGHLKSLIIKEIYERENHVISREMLMKKMYLHYDSKEHFEGIMESFHNSGMILTTCPAGTVLYTMPEKQVIEIKIFLEGKSRK